MNVKFSNEYIKCFFFLIINKSWTVKKTFSLKKKKFLLKIRQFNLKTHFKFMNFFLYKCTYLSHTCFDLTQLVKEIYGIVFTHLHRYTQAFANKFIEFWY